MKTYFISSSRRLSDRELVDRVKHLAGCERQATATLVEHLAELEERELYLTEGCSSLFTYCTHVLHLSEHAAFNRIEAARAARKFPLVLEKLFDGSVHLTAIRLLAPHLTSENHRELLSQATHQSKLEIERLIARIRPLPAVASSVRKLPARPAKAVMTVGAGSNRQSEIAVFGFSGPAKLPDSAGAVSPGPLASSPAVLSAHSSSSVPAATIAGNEITDARAGNSPAATRRAPDARVAPLSPDLYRVQFTADSETYTRLCQARELLRHQIPDGDAAAVIGLALKVLVEQLATRKLGRPKLGTRELGTPKRRPGAAKSIAGDVSQAMPEQAARSLNIPRHAGQSPGRNSGAKGGASRHIPAEVKRQVWLRDEGRCAFVGANGRRCSERGCLEFHHDKPFALGGAATVENIQLRCRAHNAHESRLCFGPRAFVRTRNRPGEVVPERVGKCDVSDSGLSARAPVIDANAPG